MERPPETYLLFAGLMLAVAVGFGFWGVEHLLDDSAQAWIAAVGMGITIGAVASAVFVWLETRGTGSPGTAHFARDFWTGLVLIGGLRALGAFVGDLVPDWVKVGATFASVLFLVTTAALSIVRFSKQRRLDRSARKPPLPSFLPLRCRSRARPRGPLRESGVTRFRTTKAATASRYVRQPCASTEFRRLS
jgi:hypothetical protein